MYRSIAAILSLCSLILIAQARSGSSLLQDARRGPLDLEVGGAIPGVADGGTRYVSYDDLLKLPQVDHTISDDTNLPGNTKISGVSLDELARSLGVSPDANLVVAICYDKYRASYSKEYLAHHHPLLVLKVNGGSQAQWPRNHKGEALGPYLISHPKFTPSFRILSHDDEPLIPFGITRIEFRNEAKVLGVIMPRGTYAPNSPVMAGYKIAQQNCYRCHNMGPEGGQMAERPWQVLAAWATADPQYFKSYIRNPQASRPTNKMPGNPQYDDATLDAIRAYFAAMAQEGTK